MYLKDLLNRYYRSTPKQKLKLRFKAFGWIIVWSSAVYGLPTATINFTGYIARNWHNYVLGEAEAYSINIETSSSAPASTPSALSKGFKEEIKQELNETTKQVVAEQVKAALSGK